MSRKFTITGTQEQLSIDYPEPIRLDNKLYEIGLTNFQTYNSIPNIDETNNKFYYSNGKCITLPIGSYELGDIAKYIYKELGYTEFVEDDEFELYRITDEDYNEDVDYDENAEKLVLYANNSTLKCELASTFEIDFTPDDCIGKVLGFSKRKLKAHTFHTSDNIVNILKVNSILIECNIATGSYINNKLAHVIYQFYPLVPPGYKIVETPTNVIYLPITVQTINNITLKIFNQDYELINFRGEEISIGLHLRKML